MDARLASIHVGTVTDYRDAEGRPWRSAIEKRAVDGGVRLTELGLEGDAVADRKHHGGVHQAVLAADASDRALLRQTLGLDLPPGALGENLWFESLDPETVCVGDVMALGAACLQVSQPRQPCNTLARRWQRPDLLQELWHTGRSGWYFRVLVGGTLEAGLPVRLLQRPHPGWTVSRTLRLLRTRETLSCQEASTLEHLSPAWRERFQRWGDGLSD